MIKALSVSAAKLILMFQYDFFKGLINTGESLWFRNEIAWVFESRSRCFNDYSCSSNWQWSEENVWCVWSIERVIIHNNLCTVHSWSLYEHQNNMLIVSHQLLWFWIQTLLIHVSSCLMIWPVWEGARTINWFLIIQRDLTLILMFWVQRVLTQEHTAGMWRLKRVYGGDLE